MTNFLIVGSKDHAAGMVAQIRNSSTNHKHVVGWIDVSPNGGTDPKVAHGVPMLGTLSDLDTILVREVVDEMLVVSPLSSPPAAMALFDKAHSTGITVRVLHPEALKPVVDQHKEIDREVCFGFPCSVVIDTKRYLAGHTVKRIFDCIVAGLILAASWPVLLLIAAIVKLSSKGPVFFYHDRVGLHGRRFKMYKFRTMIVGAERLQAQLQAKSEVSGPIFKIKDDPRIIPHVGKFLRRSGLDELPQLFNVLKGEMSLVGPRPATPNEVAQYKLDERRRLAARPGITGLWQCTRDRNALGFDRRFDLDLKYIDEWSFPLDLWILCKTLLIMWEGGGE
jgi:exopolysaccharide biosynthesis polyprenyl glycosylphosphotransferase